jgi:hypothetical protein
MKNLKTVKVNVVQGAVGDQAASWMTDEDWKEHRKYVEQLKKDGNYLKPSEFSMSFVPCPLFDEPTPLEKESYRFTTINLKKDK